MKFARYFCFLSVLTAHAQEKNYKLAPVQVGIRYGLKDEEGKILVPPSFEELSLQGTCARVREHGKWGMIDVNGRRLIQSVFDELSAYKGGLAVAGMRDIVTSFDYLSRYLPRLPGIKYGIVNLQGEWVIKPDYDKLVLCDSGSCILYCKDRNWGVMGINGKKYCLPVYAGIFPYSNGCAVMVYKDASEQGGLWRNYLGESEPVVTGGKWGLLDEQGHELLPPRYAYIGDFHEGLACFNEGGYWVNKEPYSDQKALRGGKWGYLDTKGQVAIPPCFETLKIFSGGVALVTAGDSSFLINRKGLPDHTRRELGCPGNSVITEPVLRVFCQAPAWGFIDTAGKMVISPGFSEARPFSEGLAAVAEIIPCTNEPEPETENNSTSLITTTHIRLNQLQQSLAGWGFVDVSGKLVIGCLFPKCGDFSEGFAAAESPEGLWGFINKKGEWVIPPRFDDDTQCHYRFRNGLALVRLNGKWGFINPEGKQVVPLIFDRAEEFCDGLAIIKVKDYWGAIDPSGHFVIKPQFNRLGNFSGGLAFARKRGQDYSGSCGSDCQYGYIDKSGKWVVPPKYTEALDFSEGMAGVAEFASGNLLWGYVSSSGTLVIPETFYHVDSFCRGVALVIQNGQAYYIDMSGKKLFSSAGNLYSLESERDKYHEGFVAGTGPGGLSGFRDKRFRWVVKPEYQQVSHFTKVYTHE